MDTGSIKSIVIVGGGTAGWMSAIYLNKIFGDNSDSTNITLVESPTVDSIGVGEATIHTIRSFLQNVDIDESEFIASTNATLKSGILFRNWRKPTGDNIHEYFHPFEAVDLNAGWSFHTHGLANKPDDEMTYCEFNTSVSTWLSRHLKSPKLLSSENYEGPLPYAYHFDASEVASYLRDKAISRGVKHIIGNVDEVKHSKGLISEIRVRDQSISADFFIDCTGFSGVLINQVTENNWVSYEDSLPCNRAVAIQKKFDDPSIGPRPFTTSTALSNGWVWEIDLQTREGTGYVYAGDRMTPEEAELELREYLGEDTEVLAVKHLKMSIGRRKKFWSGNCLCIGLSTGFIEPLESTGIYIIELGLKFFLEHYPRAHTPSVVIDHYNKQMENFYDELRDFIVLHYCLTDRDDTPFWIQAAKSHSFCPELVKKLELWKHKGIETVDFSSSFSTLFNENNYRFISQGMGFTPNIHNSIQSGINQKNSQQLYDAFDQIVENALQIHPQHNEMIQKLVAPYKSVNKD